MDIATIATLNDLIETSKDGEQGFARASQNITDSQLRILLLECSARCRDAAAELEGAVRDSHGEPERRGSALGAAHRGWLDLKAAFTGRSTGAILEECERGEDVAKGRYEHALESIDLPPALREMIQRQYTGVMLHHEAVRRWRDRTAVV